MNIELVYYYFLDRFIGVVNIAVLWVLSSRGGFKGLMAAYGPGERKVIGGSQKVRQPMTGRFY